MDLTYIAPSIVEAKKVAKILRENIVENEAKWKPSIVLYVLGVAPSIGAMERFIASQGTFSTKSVVLYHSKGYFVVRFTDEEERDKVLYSGPHHMLKRTVIIKS